MHNGHDGYALTITWDREGPLKRLRERSGLSVWDAALILRGADFFTTSSAVVAAEEGKPVAVSLVAALEKEKGHLPRPGSGLEGNLAPPRGWWYAARWPNTRQMNAEQSNG